MLAADAIHFAADKISIQRRGGGGFQFSVLHTLTPPIVIMSIADDEQHCYACPGPA